MNIADLYLNLVVTGASNVVSYFAQGVQNNANNETMNPEVNKVFKYRMNESNSIFLIAYPNNLANTPVSLNFTYNLTADYYPLSGMTI